MHQWCPLYRDSVEFNQRYWGQNLGISRKRTFWMSPNEKRGHPGFLGLFCYRKTVAKTQSLIEFQNTILITILKQNKNTRYKYFLIYIIPAGICLLKVHNKDTKTRCEICSKLTIKTPEWRHMFKVNNKDIRTTPMAYLNIFSTLF